MEKKTKHRILGIFVIVALVILSLPFFETNKTSATDIAAIKSPPFPGEQDVASNTVMVDEGETILPQSSVQNPILNESLQSEANQEQEDVIKAVHPSVITQETPSAIKSDDSNVIPVTNSSSDQTRIKKIPINTLAKEAVAQVEPQATQIAMSNAQASMNTGNEDNSEEDEPTTKQSITKSHLASHSAQDEHRKTTTDEHKILTTAEDNVELAPRSATQKSVSARIQSDKPQPILLGKVYPYVPDAKIRNNDVRPLFNRKQSQLSQNGLIQLKNAAWVIEVGNYQNKKSALELVNHLREYGYRAFIQQVSTSGSRIQVFVGPELKKQTAYTLAQQLETDLHIRGIVISYKPLDL